MHCGSPSYAAPEIVSRQLYDGPPVDVWSLGVVLFAMITGYLPFHSSGSNKDELCQRIVSGVYKTPDWISDESRDLLRGMLTTDPRRRLTVEQVRVVSFGLRNETQTKSKPQVVWVVLSVLFVGDSWQRCSLVHKM